MKARRPSAAARSRPRCWSSTTHPATAPPTWSKLSSHGPTLIRSPHNGGYAYGNNQALRVSRGESVLMLNPDTTLAARLDRGAAGASGPASGGGRHRTEAAAAEWQHAPRVSTLVSDASDRVLSHFGSQPSVPQESDIWTVQPDVCRPEPGHGGRLGVRRMHADSTRRDRSRWPPGRAFLHVW